MEVRTYLSQRLRPYAEGGRPTGEQAMLDWKRCPDVEVIPGKVSGAWLVRGTRIPVQAVLDNLDDGFSPEEIAGDIYEGLSIERVEAIAAFARQNAAHPA